MFTSGMRPPCGTPSFMRASESSQVENLAREDAVALVDIARTSGCSLWNACFMRIAGGGEGQRMYSATCKTPTRESIWSYLVNVRVLTLTKQHIRVRRLARLFFACDHWQNLFACLLRGRATRLQQHQRPSNCLVHGFSSGLCTKSSSKSCMIFRPNERRR